MKKLVLGAVLSSALVTAGLVPGVTGSATAAPNTATLGASADQAAGSCWEIKQGRPTATNGAYWLLTSKMAEPQQFYCDMTTDGGGWVLVGKGRDGWVDDYAGQGAVADLLTPDLATMGPKTTQYPSRTIDALLNGGRVDSLTDGIRLRRATNTSGTAWQEVRMRLSNRDRWVWTFGAEHPLGTWAFDSRSGSGGITSSFGLDTTYQRVVASPQQSQTYRLGFAYGSRVAGSSTATSYLWSATNNGGGALPYTQVYLRPHVLSTDGFSAIGDGGTSSAFTMPAVPNSNALDSPFGVTGIAGDASDGRNVEVNAFTQSGNTMYVGGNFATVQRDAAGTGRVDQPFLAGFDITTGDLVQNFDPRLNEQVHALTTLPDGTVVAGGEFTQANGAPAAGVVALDPSNGDTKPGWNVQLANTTATGQLKVFSLDVSNGNLYIGGAFNQISGGTRTGVAARNMGRVALDTWMPDNKWNPKLNGTVNALDVSDDGTRVYAAGFFGQTNTTPARRGVVLSTAAGAAVAVPWTPTWSNTKDYQRAVKQVGNRVYFGGSEHSLFGYDPSNMNRVSGSIAKKNGDIQAIANDGTRMLFAGCHCADYFYENAYTWPTLSAGWTEADALDWVAAVDPATGKHVPDFKPAMRMRQGSGVWAIKMDTSGVLWVGGDIDQVTTKTQAKKWAGGFARFEPADSTAPPTPTNFQATAQDASTVTLSWNLVTDAGGGVRYEVLRDDRVVGATTGNTKTLTVPKGGNNRFFVRAIDKAGNYSASTPFISPGP